MRLELTLTFQAGLPTARDTTVGSLSFALLRFALAVCFGIYRIPEEVVSSTRRGTLASNKSSQKILPPRQGDVIVSNWTSYVDVLYLKAKYARLCHDLPKSS